MRAAPAISMVGTLINSDRYTFDEDVTSVASPAIGISSTFLDAQCATQSLMDVGEAVLLVVKESTEGWLVFDAEL